MDMYFVISQLILIAVTVFLKAINRRVNLLEERIQEIEKRPTIGTSTPPTPAPTRGE